MVGPRRKSWVMRTSSKQSTFDALEGRNTSFSTSRRSIAGASGGLNAPQVVVSVTEELTKTADANPEKEKDRHRSGRNWFPFPRIHIPFFSRGTKHEHKQESSCRESIDGCITPRCGAPVRHSVDIAGSRGVPPLTGLPSHLGVGQWSKTSHTPNLQCYSSRQPLRQTFSSASHRGPINRAGGSLDFWSSSMALAGFYPNGDHDGVPQWTRDPNHVISNCTTLVSGNSQTNTSLGDRKGIPGGIGRSTSDGNFRSYAISPRGNSTASPDLDSRVWSNTYLGQMGSSGSGERIAEWQTSSLHSRPTMEVDIQSPALLGVDDPTMTNEERQAFVRQSEERRISLHYGGPDVRLSIDSLQRPFGSCIEDESNRATTPHVSVRPATGQPGLSPIMMYSESLAAASNLVSGPRPTAAAGSFHHGLNHDNQFNPPPPPPISSTSAFDSALYNRSLYFEQFVLREPEETEKQEAVHERVSPRTEREHRYYDVPDYPTTIASCSNRSHLHQDMARAQSQKDDMEDENTIRAWLDELEERVAYRRKECTYRIACQRAFIKQMKDKLLASKLALNRLKHGLGPELSERVMELRMKFSSRRRLRNLANLLAQKEEDQYDLWAAPMMDMEIEVLGLYQELCC